MNAELELADLMPLAKELYQLGLHAAASNLVELARPEILRAKPETHIRRAEHSLRCHLRGQKDHPYLESAISRLLICALMVNMEAAAADGTGTGANRD